MRNGLKSWIGMLTNLGIDEQKRRARHRHKRGRKLWAEQCEERRMLAILTVSNIGDGLVDGPGDLPGSLRQAIFDADNIAGPDTITFASSLNNQTITLTEGELLITESVTIDGTIDGAGPSQVLLNITVDAGGGTDGVVGNGDGFRIFNITNYGFGPVEINGLKLTGGDTHEDGGAIYSDGDLVVKNSTISGNASVRLFLFTNGIGGGIFASIPEHTSLTIVDTLIAGNSANIGGGVGLNMSFGGHTFANGSVFTMHRSRVEGNHAVSRGGGLYTGMGSGAQFTITDSVISGNDAGLMLSGGFSQIPNSGGGIYAYMFSGMTESPASMTIAGTEISGNTAGQHGGGLVLCTKRENDTSTISRLSVYNTTISGNQAGHTTAANDPGKGGGVLLGIFPFENEEALDARFQNCTITGNTADQGSGVWSFTPTINYPGARNDVRLTNSIISANRKHDLTASNLHGSFNIAATVFNVIGQPGTGNATYNHVTHASQAIPIGGASGNKSTDNPLLGPLVYNGGPILTDGSKMLTHALLPNSPAVNAGDPSIMPNPTEFDQRGAPWLRVVGMNRIDIGAFERQANPLVGDYNFNGVVDAADYPVWRNTLGSTIDLRADGDGLGSIDVSDYNIWKMHFGEVIADGNGSGATDIADYVLWQSTYGSTTDLRADYNEDGVVDDADYDIWFDTYGSTMEVAQFGLLSSMFDPDAPPAVVGVTLGLPGVGAIDFADKVGSGEQVRSVPLIAANTLNITFSRDVNVTANALQLLNLDGSSPTIFDFSYDALSQTATWTFNTSLANGRYLVRLSDSIESLGGKALDGEFFNPTKLSDTATAVFPSGDGDEGGEFRFRFTVLAGDSDHNNIHGAANYTNWQSTEPGMIIVSTTADDWDASLAFGDVSLREAVNYANTAGSATAIQLPTGRYVLTRVGTEGSNSVEYNDLDIKDMVSVVGAGPGLSIVDATQSGLSTQRAFDVIGAGDGLTLQGVTIAHGIGASDDGLAVRVGAGGKLEIVECALVNHTSLGGGSAIAVDRGELTIRRSVITDTQNNWTGGAAVYVAANGGGSASITVGESIFALNSQYQYPIGNTTRNIQVVGNVTKTNEGLNLYDDASGGFFDTTPGINDHLGTTNYVVTSIADTFNHADNLEALSLREAVDKANTTAGTQAIWVPAWRFTLTRDRGTNATDTNASYGDIDVKESVVIRGVTGRTSVAWKPGVVDKVFDLLGDFNNDGEADYGTVSAADYTIWQNQNGSSGAWEQFSADADDDGDVDANDYSILQQNFGHTLTLAGLEL